MKVIFYLSILRAFMAGKGWLSVGYMFIVNNTPTDDYLLVTLILGRKKDSLDIYVSARIVGVCISM